MKLFPTSPMDAKRPSETSGKASCLQVASTNGAPEPRAKAHTHNRHRAEQQTQKITASPGCCRPSHARVHSHTPEHRAATIIYILISQIYKFSCCCWFLSSFGVCFFPPLHLGQIHIMLGFFSFKPRMMWLKTGTISSKEKKK